MELGFGSHLMLDCHGCPKDKLSDIDFLSGLLNTFPARIGMAPISLPSVFKYHGKLSEDWGLSGVVLIAGSHISIHTFPDKEYVFIDVFSSGEFDVDYAKLELITAFCAKQHDASVLNRGARLPRDLDVLTPIS
ncbi:MAG: S-adenosylmethionine decarboxylase [Candidatus Margulisiibacteriota bacterium]|nr:S-adenosylmethionine decarboxylase [Candidatus Margulisiibacteriota bacterium]